VALQGKDEEEEVKRKEVEEGREISRAELKPASRIRVSARSPSVLLSGWWRPMAPANVNMLP
jgi:hypothetical protein